MYAAAGGASIASRRKQKRRSREEQLIRRQQQRQLQQLQYIQQIQQIQQLVQQQRRSTAARVSGAQRSLIGPQAASSGPPLLGPGPVRCCSPYGRVPPRQRQQANEGNEENEGNREHGRRDAHRSRPPLSKKKPSRSRYHRHQQGVFLDRNHADCHPHRHFCSREPGERESFFNRSRASESDDRFVFSSSCDKDDDEDDDDDDEDDDDDGNGDGDGEEDGNDTDGTDGDHANGHGNDDDDDGSRARSVVDSRLSASTSDPRCGGAQTAGKAAWQGCNKKRGSPLALAHGHPPHTCRESDGYRTKQCEAHRRWMKKRNRIRDASHCYYGSTDDEEDYDYYDDDDEDDERINRNRRRGEVSAAVNTVLYAGLGTTALGLLISFVGTGEKGFLSTELKLLGPSLLCAGLLCCFLRVLLCICGRQCGCRRFLRRRTEKCDAKSKKAPPNNRQQQATLPTTTLHLSPIKHAKKETKQKQESQTQSLQSQPSSTLQQQPSAHTQTQSQSQNQQTQQGQHRHHSQQKQPPGTAAKGHELLLSPAQLPE